MGEEGEILYKVAALSWFPDYDWTEWTGQDGDNYYMVWRTTTAPHTEVVKVCANDLTDGSLRWETVIWEDKESDEPYPGGESGWATFVDNSGIIYASDDNGEVFALDRNGTVLWHRDVLDIKYGCFSSGGLLTGDGSSFQRIDGEGKVDWSIEGLDQTATSSWTIITPENDTMVLVHDGAVTEVTVHSEPTLQRHRGHISGPYIAGGGGVGHHPILGHPQRQRPGVNTTVPNRSTNPLLGDAPSP